MFLRVAIEAHRILSAMRIPCLFAALFTAIMMHSGFGFGFGQSLRPGDASQLHADGCTLRIHVDGLRNSIGVVGTVLFTSAEGWPENVNKAYRGGPTPIGAGERKVTVVLEGIPAGDYSIVILHDENSNMKLDRNLFGWPKEGFGFSNNPHIGFGPPPFRETLLHVGCPVTQTAIHVVYK
jgi:uncharacterized protein (DUF2141 family)